MATVDIIEAEVHLANLRSWNQFRWNDEGRQLGGEHTETIRIIEGLIETIDNLRRTNESLRDNAK